MQSKIFSSIVVIFLIMSASVFGNENYSKNFQEQLNVVDKSKNQYVCDDLHGKPLKVEGEDCLSALREYNKQRKSEGKPWCSVRRLHKNKDGCYCFPTVAKGKEITNMCQKELFYKKDNHIHLGGM